MNTVKTQRIAYLDTARGYLILLVVLGHVLIVLNPGYDRLLLTAAQEFISSFHMAAFFLIHGILLRNKENTSAPSLWTLVKYRARTLLLPYLLFETIGIFCRWALYGQSLPTGVYNLLTVRCNVGADWFLPALFVGSVVAGFLGIYQKPGVQTGMALAAILAVMLFPEGQLETVLGRGYLAFGFIMLGIRFRDFLAPEQRPGLGKLFLSFLITALCAVVNLKWGTNDFYSCTVGNPVTLILGGVSGIYLVLGLSRYLSADFLQKFGARSLIVMGTHQLFIYAATAYFPQLRGGSLLAGGLLFLAILVLEVPVMYLMNRYCGALLGKKRK